MGHGWEIVEAALPVLITVIGSANEPRPAGVRRVMRMKKAKVFAELAAEAKDWLKNNMALKEGDSLNFASQNLGQSPPEASEEEVQAEAQRRADALRQRGLLIEQWNLDDIHADMSRCGMSGSPTKVHRIQAIVLKKEGYVSVPDTEEGVRGMIHELVVDRTLG
jgi:electron transfer flavoprotein beta subunit